MLTMFPSISPFSDTPDKVQRANIVDYSKAQFPRCIVPAKLIAAVAQPR